MNDDLQERLKKRAALEARLGDKLPELRADRVLMWGEGPWIDEVDRHEFFHEGVPCLMIRNHLGAWCGYAAVQPTHPLYRLHYDRANHWVAAPCGLTLSSASVGRLCHEKRRQSRDWWFGFDCSHYGDYTPGLDVIRERFKHSAEGLEFLRGDSTYKDFQYVRAAVIALAVQLIRTAFLPKFPRQITRRQERRLRVKYNALRRELRGTEDAPPHWFDNGQSWGALDYFIRTNGHDEEPGPSKFWRWRSQRVQR